MERPIYGFNEGDGPLQLNVLHVGTEMPDGICGWLMVAEQRTPDTDWYFPRPYDFAGGLRATAMAACTSRYIVDLNRSPTGETLYPGQATTGLWSVVLFAGARLYETGG